MGIKIFQGYCLNCSCLLLLLIKRTLMLVEIQKQLLIAMNWLHGNLRDANALLEFGNRCCCISVKFHGKPNLRNNKTHTFWFLTSCSSSALVFRFPE